MLDVLAVSLENMPHLLLPYAKARNGAISWKLISSTVQIIHQQVPLLLGQVGKVIRGQALWKILLNEVEAMRQFIDL